MISIELPKVNFLLVSALPGEGLGVPGVVTAKLVSHR